MTGKRKLGQQYPHTWVSGPDPVRHTQYLVWLQQKNQANFRREGWTLTFDDWLILWGTLWSQRGRGKDQYCMTRIDPEQEWNKHNVLVITREEHFEKHRNRQVQANRLKRQQQ